MKILITGGAGFVGSHLCEKYVNEGHNVTCLDNFMTGNLVNIRHLLKHRNFKLVNGDIRNIDVVEKTMHDVDAVFHLAAMIHVDRSIVEPRIAYDINVNGTLNILEAARMLDVNKIIHASTSEVYGSAQYAPIDEKHPLDAPHSYGASKIGADRMCKAYIETYDLDIAIMRPFNIFGPRQKDSGYGGVISIFTRRIFDNKPPIIYGTGEQSRDYTYIDDVVNAYDVILNSKKKIKTPVNFGTGKDIKIKDLANLIIKELGKEKELSPVYIDPRPGEVERLICDYSKAKEIYGWEPKVDFKTGLKKFIEWYKNYKFEDIKMG
jgi:UDP-glucose 4-epimerase